MWSEPPQSPPQVQAGSARSTCEQAPSLATSSRWLAIGRQCRIKAPGASVAKICSRRRNALISSCRSPSDIALSNAWRPSILRCAGMDVGVDGFASARACAARGSLGGSKAMGILAAHPAPPCQRPKAQAPSATQLINPHKAAGAARYSIGNIPFKPFSRPRTADRKHTANPHRADFQQNRSDAAHGAARSFPRECEVLPRDVYGSPLDQARAIACIRAMISSACNMIRSISS